MEHWFEPWLFSLRRDAKLSFLLSGLTGKAHLSSLRARFGSSGEVFLDFLPRRRAATSVCGPTVLEHRRSVSVSDRFDGGRSEVSDSPPVLDCSLLKKRKEKLQNLFLTCLFSGKCFNPQSIMLAKTKIK